MGICEMLLYSIFGSCLSEMLILRDVRNVPKNRRPDFKDIAYYLTIIVDLIIGIGLAIAYYRTDNLIEPMEVIYISASAPYIIKKIKEVKPIN